MTKKKRAVSAAELMAKLQADPDFRAKQNQEGRKREEMASAWRAAEQPLLEELQRLGFNLISVWDLVNTDKPYHEALPLLLEHVQKDYPDKVKEGIARALAVPGVKFGWRILISEFDKTSNLVGRGAKAGLAAAIAVVSDDSVINDLVRLVRDQRHGDSRILLLKGLRKSALPVAKQVLDELVSDPDLTKEIQSWESNWASPVSPDTRT